MNTVHFHNTNAIEGVNILRRKVGPITQVEGQNCYADSNGNVYVVTVRRIVRLDNRSNT
jgi:hypothetical protein